MPVRRDCQRDGGTEARQTVQQRCDVAKLTEIHTGVIKNATSEASDTSWSAAAMKVKGQTTSKHLTVLSEMKFKKAQAN